VASEQVYELVAIAAILLAVVLVIFLVTIRRLRRRKAELLNELKSSPRLNSDRAFNRLEMARREAAILARQGLDVSKAQALIARAQAAFDLGKTGEAYELAQSAHESLVGIRHGTPSSSASLPPTSGSAASASPGRSSAAATGGSSRSAASPPPAAGLPKHQMESQFEMRLLDGDIAAAERSRPRDAATLDAIDFRGKAQTAYDHGRYSEAFSFALKGRRGLGGNVGAVAVSPGVKPSVADAGAGSADQAAEAAAGASRCPLCGYPTTPDDAFCRGCGTPRTPTVCSQCGAPRVPADTFCGRCGMRFS
jgi:hypothetical protein